MPIQVSIVHEVVPLPICLYDACELDVSRLITSNPMMLVEVSDHLVSTKIGTGARNVANEPFLELLMIVFQLAVLRLDVGGNYDDKRLSFTQRYYFFQA
jgi:hypothetical protein